MHRYEVGEHSSVRHLSHFNSLFTGWGSHAYDVVMVRLTRRLYHRVIADLAALRSRPGEGAGRGNRSGHVSQGTRSESSRASDLWH